MAKKDEKTLYKKRHLCYNLIGKKKSIFAKNKSLSGTVMPARFLIIVTLFCDVATESCAAWRTGFIFLRGR